MTENTEDKPMNRGRAGKGRPKGSRNKTTLAAKEAIERAAEGLGGVEGLVAWANSSEENKTRARRTRRSSGGRSTPSCFP